MNITLEVSGGFAAAPGLSAPHVIDTAAIDPARASEIELIVRSTHFFDLPARVSTPAPGAADYFVYALTIKDGDRVHTVVLTDPVSDDGLMRLIDILKTSPQSR